MPDTDAHGGFADVRDAVDGHPMLNLFRYAGRYWVVLLAATAAALLLRVAVLIPDFAITAAIDRVISAPGEAGLLADFGLISRETVPAADVAGRMNLLYQLTLLAGVSIALKAVMDFLMKYLFESTAQRIQHDLRYDAYDHIQRLSMDFFDSHQTGGMMAILNSDINRLENFFNNEIRQIVEFVVMVTIIAGAMLYLAPRLAVYVLGPMPLIAAATAVFIVWIEPKYKRIRELVALLNSRLANNLGGAAIIKSFNRYDVELDRVSQQSTAYRDEKIGAIRVRKAFFATLQLVIGGVFLVVLAVGGGMVVDGAMTVGTFALFFLFLRRLDGPMQRIGKTANNYQKAKSSAERVFGVLGFESSIRSPPDAVRAVDLNGDVQVDDVRFSYDPGGELILDGVSLSVAAGETVGLAGTSGSGKSTLLKLLPRFYDVDSGAIRVDGVDVREYDVDDLRDAIGVVEQSPYMFSGTIRENIAYGDSDLFSAVCLTSADELPAETIRRIEDAARAAGAEEFIRNLPDGYDTQVGERGVKLSGGQRQRISIARAVLNDPAIIILDEATSDVDTRTEEIIQRNLDRLCEDRTAFVIAHRLSTIRDADRIVMMEDGEVVETGTHDELLDRDGTYAALWGAQSDADDRDPQPSVV